MVTAAREYYGAPLGPLNGLHHGVTGDVYAVDSRTLFIKNFNYDGEGPGNSFLLNHFDDCLFLTFVLKLYLIFHEIFLSLSLIRNHSIYIIHTYMYGIMYILYYLFVYSAK